MNDVDHIIVGSGINSLVAAAILGKRRRKVLVLERNDRVGGCLRTEEITLAGFSHDVMAMTISLFLLSPAYKILEGDLRHNGLQIVTSELPTATLMPDGTAAVLSMNRAINIAMLEQLAAGDGTAFDAMMTRLGQDADFLFSILGASLWSGSTLSLLLKQAFKRAPRGLMAFFGEAVESARASLENDYQSDVSRALFAPWVLHSGMDPDAAFSSQMAKVIMFAVEAIGCPIVKGGVGNLVEAFRRTIEMHGGTLMTNAEVDSIQLEKGRARGVALADGRVFRARKSVICSVTPNQLYGHLLRNSELPASIAGAVTSYRYGRGDMQIHYALSAPPRWRTPGLGRVAIIHLTPGLDGVSRAANEATRCMLPEAPTICVGQPAAVDATRVPPGKSMLWLQLLEAPRYLKGDAAGKIAVPPDGRWTEDVREKFANRVEDILAHHIEGFRDTVLCRRSYSPSDLEAMNVNLVGGDPYGGACSLDQLFVWRPFKSTVNHRTHIPRLYHIGASTHPGAGLGGGSGYLVASTVS